MGGSPFQKFPGFVPTNENLKPTVTADYFDVIDNNGAPDATDASIIV